VKQKVIKMGEKECEEDPLYQLLKKIEIEEVHTFLAMAMPNGDGNGNLKHFPTIPPLTNYYAPAFSQKVYYISVEPDFSAVALFDRLLPPSPFAKLT